MSWREYEDLYAKAQDTGKMHLYLFDLKDSQNHYYAKDNMRENLEKLLNRIYKRLKELERERGHKILHDSKFLNIEGSIRADTFEPSVFMGDLMVFTTIRDSIDAEEVYQLFSEAKSSLGLNHYEFHFANGYYETDDYKIGRASCRERV